MTNYEIWQSVLADFELKVSKPNFTTWFKHTGIAKYDTGQVVICVPNAFTKSWLENKYHKDIIATIEKVTGKPIKKIEYRVESMKNIEEQECTLSTIPTVSTPETPIHSSPKFSPGAQFGLNIKYTFDTFIVGKGNELAHAAAQAVADRPGEAYNPLFIYGGVGLGKTHLLQAIGHEMLTRNPSTRILYVSSEKFTNEFVSSVKSGKAKEFKDRYRNVDLLLIDDIQFIGGKEQTQEEFFHTFNELHQQGKQVVMSSDRPPKAIPALEDRLRSRFEWGMIADIANPDLETRLAILESKSQEKQFPLEPDILNAIATTVQSNIRELEGALNKIIAYHQLKNIAPTKESIKSVLASFEQQGTRKAVTPRETVNTVAEFFDVAIDDILGKSREKRLAFPRQIVMYLLREELKMSYPAIGTELGGRDHTTAMHAHTKIRTELENDLKLKQDLANIKQRLYSDAA
ncbi:MAG: chromosomal replication initiator protein DnaA [Candidatus Magasanikbacteria bacterium CG_4_9_14_0_2_um_filter_42_11]|uniref:Chromosomal replication initiator protein DnaA n=1 Tax=Candidatus Magasanikbacteria bacterium CG_4_9_14_0_2_um_filter_42_11 TaxID=1974643 RepID=A0A2M8FA96_9BACT|nr:MAG: chromosomal replication initiator protein DnaA [Candidatus Magasanikbacteria bacterium CG10_big_fil_rev_8_21_14_0_10_43_9]PIY92073.1 MAG: chromosomal replication initiator protein DnaA [Candidatus Magasanikbacteria bacterium CG_4_10_14_0_8_um_filter_42_12]PJC52663.1 MAG: chromosomal replication initiator protein DnaA [Candidatus Magasanikbacteria bacterium CG_4_9_14_0_2_um_filter_42_11]